jgi:hypothetical protein
MNINHSRASAAMRALIRSYVLAFGIAHAADQTTTRLDASLITRRPNRALRAARLSHDRLICGYQNCVA